MLSLFFIHRFSHISVAQNGLHTKPPWNPVQIFLLSVFKSTDVIASAEPNKNQRSCQILSQLPSGRYKTNMATKNKTPLEMIARI